MVNICAKFEKPLPTCVYLPSTQCARQTDRQTCKAKIKQKKLPLCQVMVSGSMSSLTNFFTSSGVNSLGLAFSMPNFYVVKKEIAFCNFSQYSFSVITKFL